MNSIRRPRSWFEKALLDPTGLIPLNTSRRHDPRMREVVRDVDDFSQAVIDTLWPARAEPES